MRSEMKNNFIWLHHQQPISWSPKPKEGLDGVDGTMLREFLGRVSEEKEEKKKKKKKEKKRDLKKEEKKEDEKLKRFKVRIIVDPG